MGAIWPTKCSVGEFFTLRGIYWSTQFVLTAENDPYASGHLHWSRDSLRAPSPGRLHRSQRHFLLYTPEVPVLGDPISIHIAYSWLSAPPSAHFVLSCASGVNFGDG